MSPSMRPLIRLTVLCTLLCAVATCLMAAPSPFTGPRDAVAKRWAFRAGHRIEAGVRVAPDGRTLYVGSWDNTLYALNPDGTRQWAVPTGHLIGSSAALGADGTIYVGSFDRKLYAIAPNGTVRWTFEAEDVIPGTPAIGPDGTIYFTSRDHRLYALNTDGTRQWTYAVRTWVEASPAVGPDGTIYIGGAETMLYAITRDGTRRWACRMASQYVATPLVGADGMVYVGDSAGKLHAVNPDGTIRWSLATRSWIVTQPAQGADDTVYVGSLDGKLYAVTPDGTLQWTYDTGGQIRTGVAIDAEGVLYVGSDGGALHAVRPDGTRLWAFDFGWDVRGTPAIGRDGAVYIGSPGGTLYALGAFTLVPTLDTPADGAAHIAPGTPLRWTAPASPVTGYQVHVATDPAFTRIIGGGRTPDLTMPAPAMDPGARHYWRVRCLLDEQEGPWSPAWSFMALVAPPETPELVGPEDDATGLPRHGTGVTLSWTPAARAQWYVVEVSDQVSMANPRVLRAEGGPSIEVQGLAPLTQCFWRVKAVNPGGESAWTPRWAFTTRALPGETPDLLTPADGDQQVAMPATFTWTGVPAANRYEVQIGRHADLNGAPTRMAPEPRLEVTDLEQAATFWWRVRAWNPLGPGPWSAARSFRAKPLMPGAVTLDAPADGAADVPQSPTLTWQAAAQATGYTVEVASDHGFADVLAALTIADGTSADLVDLPGGATFWWRVRATNRYGIGPWTAARRFTTRLLPPAAPALETPADGQADLPGAGALRWQPVRDTAGYQVQVAVDAGFGALALDTAVTGTQADYADLTSGKTYWWRVRGRNAAGDGPWSGVRSFAVKLLPPAAPVLPQPADGAADVPAAAKLAWQPIALADSYQVQVATDHGFANIVADLGPELEAASQPPALRMDTTYWWRVRASNAAGDGPWSAAWSFTTAKKPAPPAGVLLPAPTLTMPYKDTRDAAPALVTLRWTGIPTASGYEVQLARNAAFTLDARTVPVVSAFANMRFEPGTPYWWRVRTLGPAGPGPWSETWTFTTLAAVPKADPALQGPADGAEVDSTVTLSWQAPPTARSHYVDLSFSPDFSAFAQVQTRVGVTSYELKGLTGGQRVWWRVRPYSGVGPALAASEIRSFTVKPGPLGVPMLTAPRDGGPVSPRNNAFSWLPVAGATGYRVQAAADRGFADLLPAPSSVIAPFVRFSSLPPNTTVWWRVKAVNAEVEGEWSEPRSVQTMGQAAIEAPTDLVPTGGLAAGTGVARVQLAWTAPNGVTAFFLEIATDEAMLTPVEFTSMGGGTPPRFTHTTSLLPPGHYWWRVCGNLPAGAGPWSTTGAFRIDAAPAMALPGVPRPADPADGAKDQPERPILRWEPMPEVDAYTVQVARDAAFADVVYTGETADTEIAPPALKPGTLYWWHVRAVNAGGEGSWAAARKFTTAGAPPAADPGVVVFSAVGTRGSQVAIMNADGTNRRVVVPRTAMFPSLSKDGKRIAYCVSVNTTYQVFTANVDGSDERQVTRSATSCWTPVFTADGRIIYVGTANRNMDLFIINADGTGERQLTTDPADDAAARTSADGKWVAFARRTTPDIADIWLLDLATGQQTQVTEMKARSWSPCFNADGTKLLFYANATGVNQTYVLDLATKTTTRISPDAAQADVNARYTNDGRVVFVRGSGATRRLWIMQADGTGAKLLSDGRAADYDPDCGPGRVE